MCISHPHCAIMNMIYNEGKKWIMNLLLDRVWVWFSVPFRMKIKEHDVGYRMRMRLNVPEMCPI